MSKVDLSEISDVDTLNKMKIWFLRFSEQTSGSPMYHYLAKRIAEDSELMTLASKSDSKQPIPNLFLGAVNYLLYKNKSENLTRFYPNHGGAFQPTVEFTDCFNKFCSKHSEEIITILRTRSVQTNEVRRCALLLPGILFIEKQIQRKGMALIDVGTASGLNLFLDKYKYLYTDKITLGDPKSLLLLACEIKSEIKPQFSIPLIISRIGIDLNPIDLSNPDEELWALALMWPDQPERIERLIEANKIRRSHHLDLFKTKGNEALENILPTVDGPVCVMHSFTLNQFTPEQRNDFENVFMVASKDKSIWRLSLEWLGTLHPTLIVENYIHGKKILKKTLADCHQHGEWIDFKPD